MNDGWSSLHHDIIDFELELGGGTYRRDSHLDARSLYEDAACGQADGLSHGRTGLYQDGGRNWLENILQTCADYFRVCLWGELRTAVWTVCSTDSVFTFTDSRGLYISER